MTALTAVAGALAVTLATACSSSYDARLERARELTYERRPKEAVEEYRVLLASLENRHDEAACQARAVGQARLGDLFYLELGDFQAAADAYRRLIVDAPSSEEAWAAREKLADIARRHLADLHEAIAQYQALAGSGRQGADRFAYQAAKGYFELTDFEQCRKECLALAARSPDGEWTDDALFLAATAFQFESRHEGAIAEFQQLRERWPGTELAARALYQVGQSQVALGRYEDALATFLESLKVDPDPLRVQPELQRVRRFLATARAVKVGDLATALGEGPAARVE